MLWLQSIMGGYKPCFTMSEWQLMSSMHQCKSDPMATFRKQHTLNVMADLICTSMDHWINRHHIEPPQWQLTNEPILLRLLILKNRFAGISSSMDNYRRIGWQQLRFTTTNDTLALPLHLINGCAWQSMLSGPTLCLYGNNNVCPTMELMGS